MWHRQLRSVLLTSLVLSALFACRPHTPHADSVGQNHDLSLDERHGGHTLERHVAQTDAQLRERLQHEPKISAASTYTGRAIAERTVAAALAQNSEKVSHWIARGPRRPNLVLDYTNPTDPIGRVMFPRSMGSIPCDHAIVVLKAEGDTYYVLTSYPECKP